ncbi:MAG: glycosyltransferase [Prevotella sp.]|nr:glycosyltransferase [Prevotella sp.]
MSKHPKISIVTVCYNAEKDIEKTILSVINQTYDNIEYIVIDGGSNDKTLSIIDFYANKINKVVSEPDNGIFDAMNKGLDLATGDWINFMNSGDLFHDNNTIEKVFCRNITENIGVIYGNTDSKKGVLKMTPFYKQRCMLSPMGICHQSLFVRADLAKIHKFDLSYKVTADYNMIKSIYNNGYKLFDTNITISFYDLSGFSAQNAILQLKETAQICKMEGSWIFYLNLALVLLKQNVKRFLRK